MPTDKTVLPKRVEQAGFHVTQCGQGFWKAQRTPTRGDLAFAWISGTGNTPAEALDALEEELKRREK